MFQYAFLITMIPIKPIFTKDEKAIGMVSRYSESGNWEQRRIVNH